MLIHQGTGRLFVAVPCYGQMPAQTAMALRQFGQVAVLTGNCHVDDARNILIAKFLETDADELLFVDADMAFEDLSGFLARDRDVVGIGCPKKSDDPCYNVNVLPGEIWADEDGLIEVDGVGTGLLKIKRDVLESLARESRSFTCQDLHCTEIFERAIIDGKRLSGDLNFCRKWRALGGQIFVDPEVRISHVGEKTWSGTYGSYLRRANGLDLSYGIERIRNGHYQRADVIGLIEDWGNEDYSAGHEFLAICIEAAQQVKTIIETGSGVTSLAMAATGAEVHSLEHDPVWLSKVLAARDRLGLKNLHVHYAPLDHGWYTNWQTLPWDRCDMVVCDGPPRQLGDRDILFQNMPTCPGLILQDDVKSAERDGYVVEIWGEIRPFAVMRGENEPAINYG